jgi:hypothetical protein
MESELDARARMEAKRRTLLADIERALLDALADSPDVHRALWRLQREGWTLHVSIDCARDAGAARSVPAPRATARRDPEANERQPPFRIDADDLRFLRALGIDPTRRARRRRT